MTSRSTISQSVKYGLHFIGIWPGTPFPGLRKVCWVLSAVLCQIGQYKYMITHFNTDDFIEWIETLSLTMTYTLMIVKLTVAWFAQRAVKHIGKRVHFGGVKRTGMLITLSVSVLCEIISTMEVDCTKYAVVDTNNVISKTADLSFRLTSMIPALYMVSVCCHAVGTLTNPRSNDSMDRQLLLNMDLPFDINQSLTYELVLVVQIIYQVMSAYTFSLFSALLLMTILHAGCVIDILCCIVKRTSAQDDGQFRFVAMRHQEIILFTERIERLFTYIALSQLLSNTLIICCLGFLFITALQIENGLPLILKSCIFYIVICLEIFVYCFAGEYLDIKSKMIVDAAYQMSWYDFQPATSRQLVLLILKSQKGLPLTFGKFSSLSLQSFANIMKASASYMSVLLAMS
nr:odorant receptor 4-like [Megalopta genalis]